MIQHNPNSDREFELSRIHVLSIAEGFFHSSVLFALLKLKIFELIGDESKPLNELADKLNAKAESVARLLNAGIALKLLESKDGSNYRVSSECRAVLLPSSGENYLGNFIRNMDYFRQGLAKLDEAVLNSAPTVDPTTILGSDKDSTREFALAMHNNAMHRGKELAKFLDTTGCKTLLDLGSGPGTYAFHLGLQNPDLVISLSDLPEMLEIAKEIQERFPLKNKVNYLPLDVLREDIPGTYDMIFISNTLHMLGEKASRDLLKRLYKSINQGGSLVIQAQFLRDNYMGDRWPIFMDLIQLCVTPEGRNHSVGETKDWLTSAGYTNIEYNSMSIINTNSFLRGYKL